MITPRWLVFVVAFCLIASRGWAEQPPEPAREFRAAWVATVHNLDWPSKPGLPAERQKAELREILDTAVELRLNAIILQVRPSSDALYVSKFEPWSAFLTGSMGRAPEPAYDPLAFAVAEAHSRGLELHAWFNPFRALTSANARAAGNHVSKTHPEWVRRYASQLWLDPGESGAREHARAVILDVVKRYDIDGVHIDDYFYPYPVKNSAGVPAPFPDDAPWQRYQKSGGKLSREDWRRQNIDELVESLYRGIKAEKRWVKFGISPFGIWRPGVPETIEAQLDAYAELYADSRRWVREGWCDYFSPQLYWSIAPAKQSFPVLFQWWSQQAGGRRHLWPGIATERIGSSRPASEIVRQIGISRSTPAGSPGHLHWNFKALRRDAGGIKAALLQGPYQDAAIPPAYPWLGNDKPAAPAVRLVDGVLSWTGQGDVPPRWWVVQTQAPGGDWKLRLLPETVRRLPVAAGARVVVRAVDRFGNVSAPGQ